MGKVNFVSRLEKRADVTSLQDVASTPADQRYATLNASPNRGQILSDLNNQFYSNTARGIVGAAGFTGAAGLGAYGLYRMLRPKVKPQPLEKIAATNPLGQMASDIGDRISNAFTGDSSPGRTIGTNPNFTWPIIAGLPLMAAGGLQLKKQIDNTNTIGTPNDEELKRTRSEFQAALNRQATMSKAADAAIVPELEAVNQFIDALEKQAFDWSSINGTLGAALNDPIGKAEAVYPPMAALGAMGAGYAAFKIQRKLDPDRIQAEATKDAYRRMRLAKPPTVTATTVDPGEDPSKVEGLGDANNMMVTLPPALQKTAEFINQMSPLEKVAALVGSMVDHGWLNHADVDAKLFELNLSLGNVDGLLKQADQAGGYSPEQWANMYETDNPARAQLINKTLTSMAPEQLQQLGLQSGSTDYDTIGKKLGALARGNYMTALGGGSANKYGINTGSITGGMMNAAKGLGLTGHMGIPDPAGEFVGRLNQAQAGQVQGMPKPTAPPAELASAASSSPESAMGMLRGMNPMQLIALLAGVGGMASGHPLAGLIGIALGMFGPQIMSAITNNVPGAKDLLSKVPNSVRNATVGGAYDAVTSSPAPAAPPSAAPTPAAPTPPPAATPGLTPDATAEAANAQPGQGKQVSPIVGGQPTNAGPINHPGTPTLTPGTTAPPEGTQPPGQPAPGASPAGGVTGVGAGTPKPTPNPMPASAPAAKPMSPVASSSPHGGMGTGFNATATASMK